MVSGLFYPESAGELGAAVDEALGYEETPVARHTALRALLAPHGGFAYSADIQGRAWRESAGMELERVVIVGPLHGSSETGVYLPESSLFRTPLGDIEVDEESCGELETSATLFTRNDIPHLEEHAIELQLPFMKRLHPAARLVPILIGGHDPRLSRSLSSALDLLLSGAEGNTLLVVSSNLASSFSQDEAAANSDKLLSAIAGRELDILYENRGRELGLGSAAVAALVGMRSLASARFELLKRVDSARARGDERERIVQYAAGAWYA